MFQTMASVKVIDETSKHSGVAGAVVSQENGLVQVRLDSDRETYEFRVEQLQQL